MNHHNVKVKKQLFSILLLLGLIVITFFIYLKEYSFHEMWAALKSAKLSFLLAGFGMMLIFLLCEAFNIKTILKTLGSKVPFLRCFEYSNIGFYFSSITPAASGGQPAQIYYMNRDNLPVAVSSITIFFTVFVYQLAMLLLGIIMAFLRYSTAVYFINKLNYLFIFGVVANILAVFMLFAFMFSKKLIPSIASFLIKAGNQLKVIKNMDQAKSKFDQSLTSFHEKSMILKTHPELFLKILLVTLLQMIALNSIPSLVYCSMGYDARHIADIFTCQALLTVSVSPVPLPGAEGVTQGGFLQVFGAYFPLKILPYAMLINRSISFYVPLLFSFLVYILTHIRTRRQSVR